MINGALNLRKEMPTNETVGTDIFHLSHTLLRDSSPDAYMFECRIPDYLYDYPYGDCCYQVQERLWRWLKFPPQGLH